MASSSTATISSSFSSLRSSFLVKKTTDRSFCSDNTYNPKQLRRGGTGTGTGNGRLNPHLRLKSRPSSPSSLRVVCLREFRTAKVTQQSWEELVLRSEAPVLVEFYASWCGPCQMVHRVVNEIAVEYRGKVHCLMLNTDSDSEVAEDYDIKAVPVVLIFKNGEKRESIIGTMPKEFYVAAIEKALET